jgi:hypothetical protein
MAGEGEEAAVRMAAVAGSAVVAGRMEDLAAVEEVRRRLLVADLMRVVEVLRERRWPRWRQQHQHQRWTLVESVPQRFYSFGSAC